MRYVAGLMMLVFFLAGVGLFVAGLRGLVRRFSARPRLRSAEGEIIRIEKRQVITDHQMHRTAEYHYPEIRYRDEWGKESTFLSEIGAGSRCGRYVVGQKIAVLYDPDGRIPSMINSWTGIWGPSILRMVAGPVFVLGASLIYWAFGDRILGR